MVSSNPHPSDGVERDISRQLPHLIPGTYLHWIIFPIYCSTARGLVALIWRKIAPMPPRTNFQDDALGNGKSANAERRVYGKVETRSSHSNPPFSLCWPPYVWRNSARKPIPGGVSSCVFICTVTNYGWYCFFYHRLLHLDDVLCLPRFRLAGFSTPTRPQRHLPASTRLSRLLAHE